MPAELTAMPARPSDWMRNAMYIVGEFETTCISRLPTPLLSAAPMTCSLRNMITMVTFNGFGEPVVPATAARGLAVDADGNSYWTGGFMERPISAASTSPVATVVKTATSQNTTPTVRPSGCGKAETETIAAVVPCSTDRVTSTSWGRVRNKRHL